MYDIPRHDYGIEEIPVFHLVKNINMRRLGGQQINHQIYLSFQK